MNNIYTEPKVVTRFEVINHLPDGEGRAMVIWKDIPFTVEVEEQDDGRTIKVFLSELQSGEKNE